MTPFYRLCSLFQGNRLFIAFLLLTAQASAKTMQDTAALVTLKLTNTPIEEVFRKIEQQTGFTFMYATKTLDGRTPVSIHVSKVSLSRAMDLLLQGKNIKATIKDNGIVLSAGEAGAPPVKGIVKPDTIPQNQIAGTVTADEGYPLPGATIQVKGSKNGVTTDAQGRFRLSGVPVNSIVCISYTGYGLQEFRIQGPETLIVQLKKEVGALDEAIVIGYGKTSRRYATGSIAKVSGSEIGRQPVSNPLSALQGRISGVLITTANGMPGGEIKVNIRGRNSLAAGTNPMYVVDGVPFNSAPLNTVSSDFVNVSGPISPLNIIPPSEIESIEVLKDADATAIYGTRGANGVVLITTKTGQKDRLSLEANVYRGYSAVARMPKFLSLKDYLAIRREGFRNDNTTPTIANAPDLMVWDTTRSTDWRKYVIGGHPSVTNVTTTLSGGNTNTRFLLGLNYRREGTVLPGNQSYTRYGGRLNVNHISTDKRFHFNTSVAYTKDKSDLIKSVDVISIATLPPNYPVYNKDGSLNWNLINPHAWLKQASLNKNTNLNISSSASYRILKNLRIKLDAGYSEVKMDFMSTLPKSSQNPAQNPVSTSSFGYNNISTVLVEPQLEYTKSTGENSFKVLAGSTWQRNVGEGFSIRGTNYSDESLLRNIAFAGTITSKQNLYDEYKYASFFSRVNYTRSNKYLLSLNYRRDGSTRFGAHNRYGNFWAVAGGWILSNELFFEPLHNAVSYAKLRGSYGLTGNDQIANYRYLSTYSAGTAYQNEVTLQPTQIANRDYGWETNRKLEFALELGVLNDRIFSTISWYRNKSDNLLVNYPLPQSTGFNNYQANLPAVVENMGWEVDVSGQVIRSGGFSWTAGVNLTVPKNKLVSFPRMEITSYATQYAVGEDLSVVKAIRFTGVDPQTGISTFEDVNKDGKISSPLDQVVIGKLSPDYFGGITNSFSFKGVNLSFLFQFIKKMALTNFYISSVPPNGPNNVYEGIQHNWKKPGDINSIQRTTSGMGTPAGIAMQNLQQSSKQFVDASFIRLNNLSIGYSFPSPVLKKLKLADLKIYVEGQNVFTITPTGSIDPETVNGFLSTIPLLKTWAAGIKIVL